MTALQDFSLPVHKSFHQPSLLAGVPKTVFVLLMLFTVGLVYFFGPPFAVIGIALYIPCFVVSKRDPNLLEYALYSLFETEFLEG
jgi:type IV secretory pathway VirB3-like protein